MVTSKTIGEVKGVFNPIQNRVRKRIRDLSSLSKPTEPGEPGLSWTFDEMMDWVTDSYIPYFVWADKNKKIDDELMNVSDVYAQWLYSNWEDLKANSKRVVHNVLPNYSKEFKSVENTNLMIVIDNFGWRYVDILREIFQNNGFNLVDLKPYISMLPTTTEISKKCLLAGAPSYNGIDNNYYASIVEKGWVPFFENSTFQYISNYKKLEEISDVENMTFVLNYLPLDSVMHKKESDLGISHDDHIRTLMFHLVSAVVEFVEKHNMQDSITLHIISDHGSTKIPKQVANGIDMKDINKFGYENITYRYASIGGKKFDTLPDNLKEDCFFLSKEKFGNDWHYICSRRGNRFIQTDDSFYIHGGLSPEETIVPYMQFKKIIAPVKHLTVVLKQTVFRYRLEKVDFEIGNPNEYPVEDIIVETVNSNIECDLYRLDWLEAKKKISGSMQVRFRKTQNIDDFNNIRLIIKYLCNGELCQTDEIKLSITMKAMYEVKDKRLFEDWD